MSKIVEFEPFKKAKEWDEDYSKFLGSIEKHFGTKTSSESMLKRLYYALRFLSGVSKSFWLFSILPMSNFNENEIKRGKLFCINWLEEILQELKGGL